MIKTHRFPTLNFSYNSLKQLAKRTSPKLDVTYTYHTRTDDKGTYVTNRIKDIQYTVRGSNAGSLPTLKYTYDAVGNITEVKEGSQRLASYVYDTQNQLTTEHTVDRNSYYIYDTYGNIRSKTNSYPNVGKSEVYTFVYGEDSWKDLLTEVSYKSMNGVETTQELEYDSIGNPVVYFNGKQRWDFEWTNGRQLYKAEATKNGKTTVLTNTYDVDGIRESKTVEIKQGETLEKSVRHDYVTLDGKVIRETYENNPNTLLAGIVY